MLILICSNQSSISFNLLLHTAAKICVTNARLSMNNIKFSKLMYYEHRPILSILVISLTS